MKTFEFYWDEFDDWGRHSYYNEKEFECWQDARDFARKMEEDPDIENVYFVEIGYDEEYPT